MGGAETGGSSEAESLIAQIQALQAALEKETDPERARQLQEQLMVLVERARAMGIIK